MRLFHYLVPLFVSAFKRAEDLATAMEVRGYRGGEGRTSYRQLKWDWRDTLALLSLVVLAALLVYLRYVKEVYSMRRLKAIISYDGSTIFRLSSTTWKTNRSIEIEKRIVKMHKGKSVQCDCKWTYGCWRTCKRPSYPLRYAACHYRRIVGKWH